MVTVKVPAAAALLAASVSTLLPVVGFVPNVAVTPLGNPDAARVTLPVNPFTSFTVTVSVVLLPCVTDALLADGASVKLGVVPVTIMENVSVLLQKLELV
jgi:formylmethanofuran dehydrogenase subunit B